MGRLRGSRTRGGRLGSNLIGGPGGFVCKRQSSNLCFLSLFPVWASGFHAPSWTGLLGMVMLELKNNIIFF